MKKINNKGFTLIELIVVIAIIAILAGILAPQYTQYLERSRESNDLQSATNLLRAASVGAADVASTTQITGTGVYIIHWRTDEKNVGGLPNFVIQPVTVVNAGIPSQTGHGSQNDPIALKLKDAISNVMGWVNEDTGVYDRYAVASAESKISETNRFAFYVNVNTGETQVSEHFSTAWVENILSSDIATVDD